jgi:hypothetical protein
VIQSSPWQSNNFRAETSRDLNNNTSLVLDRISAVTPLLLQPTQPLIKTVPRVSIVPWKLSAMANVRSFLTFLALLGACLAVGTSSMVAAWLVCCSVTRLPTVDPAGVAVDSQIDARDDKATVQGEVYATNGPWGSAYGW